MKMAYQEFKKTVMELYCETPANTYDIARKLGVTRNQVLDVIAEACEVMA